MTLGPLMIDLAGARLAPVERERLTHPHVGGVILFTRNFESIGALRDLVAELHALREPRLLVAVDHEGGPVQRFRQGFTVLPPAQRYGRLHDSNPAQALAAAEESGWLMAAELRACGIDFSFAPVLDLDFGVSAVIGERAYHRDPEVVAALARAVMRGMQSAGMAAVGKHFPGHGGVAADSHHAVPVDPRPFAELDLADLIPFRRLIAAGLPGLMPAHVIYPAVDALPAGFSRIWLDDVLRQYCRYTGALFSDDICMEGASVAGSHVERAQAALAAGCDMVLVCNDSAAADAVIEGLAVAPDPVAQARLIRMHGRGAVAADPVGTPRWQQARAAIARLDPAPQFDLDGDGPG